LRLLGIIAYFSPLQQTLQKIKNKVNSMKRRLLLLKKGLLNGEKYDEKVA